MIKREISTHKWLNTELVTSPSYGIVEEVLIELDQRVYEWDPLFNIRNENGILEQMTVGISGVLKTINVEKRDLVSPDTILAQINADNFITGSD